MTKEVLVPDVGEADEVEVIEVLVAVGDIVKANDSLVVLESDKASMEIPAPVAGKIATIAVKVGDTVDEGDLILEIEATSANGDD
ncbi:MAG: biotin/lipoyl-containing protein, partial [Pseudomonadales bacterium]